MQWPTQGQETPPGHTARMPSWPPPLVSCTAAKAASIAAKALTIPPRGPGRRVRMRTAHAPHHAR
eukprot:1159183-Pelagomonas_calceolata.AAC.6